MHGEFTKSVPRGTTLGDIASSISNVTAPKAVKPIAVKTPSFKAPKTIGHKGPPIVAGGPGSGRKAAGGYNIKPGKPVNMENHKGLAGRDALVKYKYLGNIDKKGTTVSVYRRHKDSGEEIHVRPTGRTQMYQGGWD